MRSASTPATSRRASRETSLAAGEGLPGRVWQSGRAGLDRRRARRRQLPARAGGAPRGPAAPRSASRSAARAACSARSSSSPASRASPTPSCSRRWRTSATRSARPSSAAATPRRCARKEARQRAMLDAALDCVVTMDHGGRVVEFNPAAERIFGYARRGRRRARDGRADRPARAARAPPPRASPATWRRRSRRVLDRRLEITGMRADGTTFPVELTITRIDVPGPPMFTGYLRDITDRHAAEAELSASRARIVEAADDGAPPARARPPRRRPAAARRAGARPADGARAARRRTRQQAASSSTPRSTSSTRRSTSCASSRAASTRRSSPRAGCGRRCEALAAPRARAGRGSSRVPDARFAAAVEAAAYFVVAEALTNVATLRAARRAPRSSRARATATSARRDPRRRPRRRRPGGGLGPARARRPPRGARRHARRRPARRAAGTIAARGDPMRVVIAEDSRAAARGRRRACSRRPGFDVVGQAGDAEELLRKVRAHKPDVAIVDIRMPPDPRRRRPAGRARRSARELPGRRRPRCSRSTSRSATSRELLGGGAEGVGYLLKDRVADVDRLRRGRPPRRATAARCSTPRSSRRCSAARGRKDRSTL